MAQTLKLKRGVSANLASLSLAAGEPAFTTDTGKLYIGNGTDKVLINPDVASNAATATKLATARTITLGGDFLGAFTFDGSADVMINAELNDSGVAAGTYTKVFVNEKGLVYNSAALTAADIPTITLAKLSDAGTAASKNTGTAAGNVPILDASGKLAASTLPAIAITDTFVVATEAAMLALTAEVGDVAVRTDLKKSFILKTTGATTLANWQELLTPTDVVTSVAGRTGAVTLTASDVGLGNVTNESKTTMFTSAALTGTPTAPTAAVATNNTQIATTAFVTTAVANKTSVTGNAGTATKLATARTITLAGDASGTVGFDGSADVSITVAISVIDGGTF